MTKQTGSTESPDEPTSVVGRAISRIKKHRGTIIGVGIGVGTAALVVASAVINHANERDVTEDIEPDKLAELEEVEETPISGRCNDGSTSDAIGKQGACSHHGGVAV